MVVAATVVACSRFDGVCCQRTLFGEGLAGDGRCGGPLNFTVSWQVGVPDDVSLGLGRAHVEHEVTDRDGGAHRHCVEGFEVEVDIRARVPVLVKRNRDGVGAFLQHRLVCNDSAQFRRTAACSQVLHVALIGIKVFVEHARDLLSIDPHG